MLNLTKYSDSQLHSIVCSDRSDNEGRLAAAAEWRHRHPSQPDPWAATGVVRMKEALGDDS